MVDVDEHLRRQVRRLWVIGRERGGVDERTSALLHRFVDLIPNVRGGLSANHRAERRGRIERVAELILTGQRDEAVDELVVYPSVDVDALDAAARLARVEERSVDELLDGAAEVGIGADVRGIFASELEPRADEPLRGRLLHRMASVHGARERHEVDALVADHASHRGMRCVHVLEQATRDAGGVERGRPALADQWRLARRLQHHAVARDDRGHDGIHGAQERIVPRRQDEHDAEGIAADEPLNALLGVELDVGQCGGGDRHHVSRPFLEAAANLERAVRDRAAHLPCELLGDRVRAMDHPRNHVLAHRYALLDGNRAP